MIVKMLNWCQPRQWKKPGYKEEEKSLAYSLTQKPLRNHNWAPTDLTWICTWWYPHNSPTLSGLYVELKGLSVKRPIAPQLHQLHLWKMHNAIARPSRDTRPAILSKSIILCKHKSLSLLSADSFVFFFLLHFCVWMKDGTTTQLWRDFWIHMSHLCLTKYIM